MNIELNKQQYKKLIHALSSYGFLLCSIWTDTYQKKTKENEELTNHFLKYAQYFDFEKNIEKDEEEKVLKQNYMDKVLDELRDFELALMYDKLGQELTRRDISKKYTEKELKEYADKHNGYLFEIVTPLEEKYATEFENYGLDRLEIVIKKPKK